MYASLVVGIDRRLSSAWRAFEAQRPATRRRRNSMSRWFSSADKLCEKRHRCSLTLGRCDLTSTLRLPQT